MQRFNGKWLIGVSGGPDSMALVDMAISAGNEIGIAHVNYHHRKEADEEEEYVRSYCQKKNIPFYVRNEPFTYVGNFEANAREWRYDFFVQIVKENDYAGILIAHQEDDLLETYFMQEERNLEPQYYGLQEDMMYHGIRVKRPLLHYTKKELETYCCERNIRYYVDCTNEDTSYARNRIRKEVVQPLDPSSRKLLRKEIEQKNAVVQERTCRVKAYIQDQKMDLSLYRKLDAEDRYALLRNYLKEERGKHDTKRYYEELDDILMKKNDFLVPIGKRWLVQNQGFFFLQELYEPYSYEIESLEQLKQIPKNPCFEVLPGSKGVHAVTLQPEDYPLTLRSYQEGDVIEMVYGKKRVSRFFIDRKIPQYLRRTWPILVNHKKEVVLVAGIGCNISHYSDSPSVNVVQYPLIKEI